MNPRRLALAFLLAALPAVDCLGQLRLSSVHAVVGLTADRSEEVDYAVGAQLALDLPLSLAGTVALLLRPAFPDDPGGNWKGAAFRGFVTVRASPIPRLGAISVGVGLAGEVSRARDSARDLRVSHGAVVPAGVVGLGVRVWRLEPFLDVYAVDPFPSLEYTRFHVVAGAGLRF